MNASPLDSTAWYVPWNVSPLSNANTAALPSPRASWKIDRIRAVAARLPVFGLAAVPEPLRVRLQVTVGVVDL